MSFDEFLEKKKIDRAQFSVAQPGLFREFEEEYAQMGPKSFDHSKKFLFNKLRRTYHLATQPRPARTVATDDVSREITPPVQTDLGAQAESLDSPTVELKPAFKPRFRAGQTAAAPVPAVPAEKTADSPEQQTLPDSRNDGLPAKPAYIPRFKPGTAKPAGDSPDSAVPGGQVPEAIPVEKAADMPGDPGTPPSKPAYKPRFSAKTTKPGEQPDQE